MPQPKIWGRNIRLDGRLDEPRRCMLFPITSVARGTSPRICFFQKGIKLTFLTAFDQFDKILIHREPNSGMMPHYDLYRRRLTCSCDSIKSCCFHFCFFRCV